MNRTSVGIIIKNKEVYNTVYLDHCRKMKSSVKTAYKSTNFFHEIRRMVTRGCLVANKNIPESHSNNGWKVFVLYTKSVMDLLFRQQVFSDKAVRMECLGGPTLRLDKHLLYEVDGKAEWIEVAKKYDFDHVSNNSGLGKVKLSTEQFRNKVLQLPLPPATAYEISRKHRNKLSNIYFIKYLGQVSQLIIIMRMNQI